MKPFEYIVPESLADALAEAGKGARVKLSGIDLLDELKSNLQAPEKIVSLHNVKELRGIVADKQGIKIGAATRLAEIGAHEGILKSFAALAQSCNEAATPQVRNRATLGGNLCQRPRCWYFRSPDFDCMKKTGKGCCAVEGENRYHAIFDTSPCPIVHPSNAAIALAALGATVSLANEEETREVPIHEFFIIDPKRENVLKDGEILTHVSVPDRGWKSAYLEFREKQTFDYALVACAAAAEMDGATFKKGRVVLGAVAPVPRMLPKVAAFLEGKKITPETAQEAGELAVEGATPLSQNEYKVQQAKVCVKRTLLALVK
jgi:xanthine dehydrogenase YagS FAD-binding subunit